MHVDEPSGALPLSPTPSAEVTPQPVAELLPWWWALIQVVLVSGLPTQVVVFVALILVARVPIFEGDTSNLSLEFFAMSSLIDTALVALLIRLFLALNKEDPRDVFIGR